MSKRAVLLSAVPVSTAMVRYVQSEDLWWPVTLATATPNGLI